MYSAEKTIINCSKNTPSRQESCDIRRYIPGIYAPPKRDIIKILFNFLATGKIWSFSRMCEDPIPTRCEHNAYTECMSSCTTDLCNNGDGTLTDIDGDGTFEKKKDEPRDEMGPKNETKPEQTEKPKNISRDRSSYQNNHYFYGKSTASKIYFHPMCLWLAIFITELV